MHIAKKTLAVSAGALIGASALLVPMTFADADVAKADEPAGYYDDAEGKTGDELKSSLNEIIDDHTTLSYSDVWDAVEVTDADPDDDGNVLLLYTGRSEPFRGDYNREHVWAKSHGDFGTRIGPGTDVHHLRPTDPVVNSTRSNLDFDMGGEELDTAPGNYRDGDSFEPRDEVKGDVARMIFYMAVRYEGGDGYVDLELNDEVENGSAPLHGRLSVLLQWHAADPPDSFEQNRNDVIYEQFQHNRNPFIDRPEWANAIWGDGDDPGDPPTDPPAGCEAGNDQDVQIFDHEIVTSDVTIADCSGSASASSTVTVDIAHTYRGDLSIYLFAPDGTYYILKRYDGGDGADDVRETYTADLSAETAEGEWTLSVKDNYSGDTGTLESWSIDLS